MKLYELFMEVELGVPYADFFLLIDSDKRVRLTKDVLDDLYSSNYDSMIITINDLDEENDGITPDMKTEFVEWLDLEVHEIGIYEGTMAICLDDSHSA